MKDNPFQYFQNAIESSPDPKNFQNWFETDETKMLLSTIPQTENNEIFIGLLKSAWKSGYRFGVSRAGLGLIKDILSSKIE